MEKEEPLVPTPEYELRCNAFVEEVITTVIPEHRDLDIIAVNETAISMESPSTLEGLIEKIPHELEDEELELFRREAQNISRQADIRSAFSNTAVVVIVPDRDGLEEELAQAAAEVKEIAAKHHADKIDQEEVAVPGYSTPSIFFAVLFGREQD